MSGERPFEGIRVAEFGQFIAVPFCGQLLADGGAEVMKIEAPDGDPTRAFNPLAPGETRIFISRNRGKHSLPLHLSHADARPVIDRIVDWADVVLMNFRPGLAKRLGLDPDELLAAHPRLVIASVTAFGKRGPDASQAGMDIVLQARTGLMAANGRVIDGRPAPGDPLSTDYMCAMTLSFGVASALPRRERTGRGGIVDTSLMHAAMALANNQLVRSEEHDRPVHEAALARLEEQRARHAPYEEQAAALPSARAHAMSMVYFRTFETADQAIAVACGSPGMRARFAALLGIVDPGLGIASLDTPEWETHYIRLRDQVEALIRAEPAETWVARLQAEGIPVAAVRFPIELFDDEQAHANAMFHDMEHPTAGRIRVVGPPVALDREGFRPSPPTPALGSESERILADLGYDAEAIKALIASGIVKREVFEAGA